LFYTKTLLQYVFSKTERKVINNSVFIKMFGYAEECVSIGVTWLITLAGEGGGDRPWVLGTVIY
jgi:hypothetical protein